MERVENPPEITTPSPSARSEPGPNHALKGCVLPLILIACLIAPLAAYLYGRRGISEVPYEAHYTDLVKIIAAVEPIAGPPYEQSPPRQRHSSCDKYVRAKWLVDPEVAREAAVEAAKWAKANGFDGPTTEYIESGRSESYSAKRSDRGGERTEQFSVWLAEQPSGKVGMLVSLTSTCYFPIGLPFYP